MLSWTCPHCGAGMYSSWDRRDEEIVICLACEGTFKNQYCVIGKDKPKGGGQTTTLVYCDCTNCSFIDPSDRTCDRAGITIGAHAACLSARRTNKGVEKHEHKKDTD